MESVGHEEIDPERVEPAHIALHPVKIEIEGVAAEALAHHPVFPVLFRR